MEVLELRTGQKKKVKIEKVLKEDYKLISKKLFWFDWKKEKDVYKLILEENAEILGLMALIEFSEESRFEIKILAVSKPNRGSNKLFENIAANLIAYACREAVKKYNIEGCVSLVPKTILKKHYMNKYGMIDAGRQIFLAGPALLRLLARHND